MRVVRGSVREDRERADKATLLSERERLAAKSSGRYKRLGNIELVMQGSKWISTT